MSKEKRLAVGSFAFAIISSLSLMIYRILFMKKYYNPYSLEYDLEAGKDIKIFLSMQEKCGKFAYSLNSSDSRSKKSATGISSDDAFISQSGSGTDNQQSVIINQ